MRHTPFCAREVSARTNGSLEPCDCQKEPAGESRPAPEPLVARLESHLMACPSKWGLHDANEPCKLCDDLTAAIAALREATPPAAPPVCSKCEQPMERGDWRCPRCSTLFSTPDPIAPAPAREATPHGWIVIRKRDSEPFEVTPFSDRAEAVNFYDRAKLQWSDTFLCAVEDGPRDLLAAREAGEAPPQEKEEK